MGLRDLDLKSCYETGENPEALLNEFYIPVLEQTKRYYRIAGFFSSSALAVAAKGIEALFHNHGHMYLLVSPELSERDFEIISKHHCIPEEADLFQDLDFSLGTNDHLKLLAYLLDSGFLDIKIVVGNAAVNSLFHQKIGIMQDENGDIVSFSGSINETAQAWLNNIEEFKVFQSWEPGHMVFIESDKRKFEGYWNNQRPQATVYDVPEAIREKIIQIKPRDVNDLAIMKRYVKKEEKNALSLFPHQLKAIEKWKDNHFSLMMEMATGTGKTRTAIGCVYEKLKKKEHFLTIVATPQNTLSRQWKADIEKLGISFDLDIIADGTNPKWKKEMKLMLLEHNDYDNMIVYTTHDTASSAAFMEMIQKYKGDLKILFICDEVHGIGSEKQRNALLEAYDYRIGLSATPERLFDEEGTQLIKEYFGNESFEFTIFDALHTINPVTGKPFLNPYTYHPRFIHLTDEESKQCAKLNRAIFVANQELMKLKKKHLPYVKVQNDLENLYMKRADLAKNAEEKMSALSELLEEMNPDTIRDTIIFTSDKQMEPFMEMLSAKKITRAKITEEISATKTSKETGLTERQQILDGFAKRSLQVILGIKCLDEGIDVTTARVAILMASSTNPREYIQRVGRVIRPAAGKEVSEIYDFIVLDDQEQPLLKNAEKRAALIAGNAQNYEEVHALFMKKGVDLNEYQQTRGE